MKGVTFSEYYANKGVTKAQAVRAQHAGLQAKKATVYDSSTPYRPTNCEGVTKGGSACKARPVHGHMLCVGHMRQAEAEFGDDELNG